MIYKRALLGLVCLLFSSTLALPSMGFGEKPVYLPEVIRLHKIWLEKDFRQTLGQGTGNSNWRSAAKLLSSRG